MGLLMIAGVVITVVVWRNYGAVWGLVSAFFLLGGLGWKIIAAAIGGLLPGREEKMRFIRAWEDRAGAMEFGRPQTYPPSGLYQEWRREAEGSGVSARHFLDERFGVSDGPPVFGYGGGATHPTTGTTIQPWQSQEFAELRESLREPEEPRGGLSWGAIGRGTPGYLESLAFVLNKQMGWSSMGRAYLKDVVDGRDRASSVDRMVSHLNGEGRDELIALRGPDATDEDVRELVESGVNMTRYYTGIEKNLEIAKSIASKALEEELSPAFLRTVPLEQLPEAIAGLGHPDPDLLS